MRQYNFKTIEQKWQKIWDEKSLFTAIDFSDKPKFYCLIEFPYLSGVGLHVGHGRSYSALDIVARKKRMEGYNVLFPFGWDAFGLPTENYAIRVGRNPNEIVKENIKNFKRQVRSLGLSFDWSREIDTTVPKYYKWTQWIFLKLYEKGLAYKAETYVNWCHKCRINLANEEVIDGCCERCGAETDAIKREQWLLKITDYAEKLLQGLEDVDYLDRIKALQVNWIGKSEGTEIFFPIEGHKEKIKVFTTRPDTLFGATYLVLAPEHNLIEGIVKNTKKNEVVNYCDKAKRKGERERKKEDRYKDGVFIDAYAINPATKEKIPIWVSEYVIISYGTGAIMGVPAHDQRDWEFAREHNLPMRKVISNNKSLEEGAYCDVDEGTLINSGFLNGLAVKEAINKVNDWLEDNNHGKGKVIKYSLRDWIFSRQHYWGEPIPIVYCNKCGTVPIPFDDLPVELPYVEKYLPTGTGESPLANITEWVNTKCPKCAGPAKRETDTMPNWAGSSWYYLRYVDPNNDKIFADKKKIEYWLPVDLYNGGMEHTTLHLLYSRFWHKVLYDLDLVSTPEPYLKRIAHGMILGEDGEKISKSRGNVINPDDIVEKYGADVFRGYEMFIGAYDLTAVWSTEGIEGIKRFASKIWELNDKIDSNSTSDKALLSVAHKSIIKVTDRINTFKFNTALSQLMQFVNEMLTASSIGKEVFEIFLKLLAPFMPHMAEELWEKLGHADSIFKESWPRPNLNLIKEESIDLIVQINGKIKTSLQVDFDLSEEECKERSLTNEKVKKFTENKKIKKVIFVYNAKSVDKHKLVNIVVEGR
ncbi:MAG: leucine--tRNA ligase [Planctomycetota bacterium]